MNQNIENTARFEEPPQERADRVRRMVGLDVGYLTRATEQWLATAGKEIGSPQHLTTQVGCHMEEFAEFLHSLSVESNAGFSAAVLQELAIHLSACADTLKQGLATVVIHDRVGALDALCDMSVTGNGVAYLAGFDKVEADKRVVLSNWSKFNADGTPVILDGGKVGKGLNYLPPVLDDLV